MNRIRATILLLLSFAALSCSHRAVEAEVSIADDAPVWPDYSGVTVPSNIAPLNISYTGTGRAVLVVDDEFCVRLRKGAFQFGKSTWCRMMRKDSVSLKVVAEISGRWTAYDPIVIKVSRDEIDPFVTYRLIPPGYQGWKRMGIYQRDLTSYDQKPIYENRLGGENCVNCHVSCGGDPEKRVFHLRADFGGTILVNDGEIMKLNTKTDSTISALVYPYWHPSGKYIAFTVNSTKQAFFSHDPNRIEVFDSASDVVVYDVERNEILWSPLTKQTSRYETFPTFSPDGKTLYFCSSAPVDRMPDQYDRAHYDLMKISFDPETGTFGDELETVYDASSSELSVSFPRVSPDGRFLCFTRHGYGNFSIWHKDADLWMIDLESGESWPIDAINSDDVDSYHSWSSNGRWLLFSSRRDDGLYTKLYISHIDENGVASKPFLMPQQNPRKFYDELMFSYNIPEFLQSGIQTSLRKVTSVVRKDKGTDVGIRPAL